jgi:hypothetical protein
MMSEISAVQKSRSLEGSQTTRKLSTTDAHADGFIEIISEEL